jgi:hypothetical protein
LCQDTEELELGGHIIAVFLLLEQDLRQLHH